MKEKAGQLIYFFHEISASISTVCLKENKTRECVCALLQSGSLSVGHRLWVVVGWWPSFTTRDWVVDTPTWIRWETNEHRGGKYFKGKGKILNEALGDGWIKQHCRFLSFSFYSPRRRFSTHFTTLPVLLCQAQPPPNNEVSWFPLFFRRRALELNSSRSFAFVRPFV
jgi:hypothetical protein